MHYKPDPLELWPRRLPMIRPLRVVAQEAAYVACALAPLYGSWTAERSRWATAWYETQLRFAG